MTKEELILLDNYGHKSLKDITKEQLKEYCTLLQMRIQEVKNNITKGNKGG